MNNPILKKEIKVGSRSVKYVILLLLYNVILSIAALFIMVSVNSSYYYTGTIEVRNYMDLFKDACWIQFFMIVILVPVITAPQIAGERERQTLDMLLTTPLTKKSIITGKVISSTGIIMLFVISSVPILSLMLTYGGVNWIYLLVTVVVLFVHCLMFGNISIFSSVVTKKTVPAIVLSYVLEAMMLVTPAVLLFIKNMLSHLYETTQLDMGWMDYLNFILLPNPIIGFYRYMENLCGSERGIQYFTRGVWQENAFLQDFLNNYWVIVNLLIELAIAYLFWRLAAAKLEPLPKKKRKLFLEN